MHHGVLKDYFRFLGEIQVILGQSVVVFAHFIFLRIMFRF